MHLKDFGAVSCFSPFWIPLGRCPAVAVGLMGWWGGHSLFSEMAGNIFLSPNHVIILFAFFLCHFFPFPYPFFFFKFLLHSSFPFPSKLWQYGRHSAPTERSQRTQRAANLNLKCTGRVEAGHCSYSFLQQHSSPPARQRAGLTCCCCC